MGVPRICLDCSELALPGGSRCRVHVTQRERRRNAQPKRQAYLNPEYRAQSKHGVCWLCGEAGADTRDHVVPVAEQMRRWGEVRDHRTQPAHRECNASRGARV